MIYGRGFPREVQFGSGLIDLGDDKNITALRWDADTPLGTAVEMLALGQLARPQRCLSRQKRQVRHRRSLPETHPLVPRPH